MANRRKNWTREEEAVLRSAVNAHPDNPHAEFMSVSQIVKKSKAAVNSKYRRMYGPNRVLSRKARSVQSVVPTTINSNPQQPKKKLNALQRFVKRIFNI